MLLFFALLSPAHAQGDPAPIQWAEQTVLEEEEFQDLRVEGSLVGPRGAAIFMPTRPGFSSMIRVRANFRPEMHDSVDEVR